MLPFGMTHPNDTNCSFANDKLPTGFINTCCSLNTATAAENLVTFGHDALAKLLQMGMASEKLPYIAKELRRAADSLRGQYVEFVDDLGARRAGVRKLVHAAVSARLRAGFEEALASMRKAADWYEKVGRLGFGVEVWY